ncbi:MAG: asparagine synthase (glutamine-hydrolyzing) [Terriglobales bacterium]
MCGILGYSHIAKRLPEGVLDSALHGLSHRGPDQQGRFVNHHISLGAVRLRIIDLESGDQPLLSPDGDVIVIFNGEIFNHHLLRAELESLGHIFRTRCDTEVVLHAFLQWGTASFARLRGMFAIAIWKQSEQRLILARDHAGIKPLYYFLQEQEIYFGSELKCILAHPGVPRNICMRGLNCYLRLNYVPGPYTLIEGVTKVMPGEMLEWSQGRCKVSSYLPAPAPANAPRSADEACEELDHLLDSAVREQLVSDVPLGIWLSGGLDSSTMLHYAAAAHTRRLRTFSVTFRGHSFDESSYMKEVSSFYGTEHNEFDLNTDADLVGAIERMAYYSDEPSADAGALPAWFLAEMTRKHVTVVLTGEGADELFGGYLTYQADRYSAWPRRMPALLRRAARSFADHLPVSDEKISLEYKIKRFLDGLLLSPEDAHVFWNGTFSEAEKQRLFLYSDRRPLEAVFNGTGSHSGLQRFLDFDQRYYLPDDILYKVDRMTMAHSLEARPPFLDPRIVEFASRLPLALKINGSTTKYVLRRLMRDKLLPAVLRRPKIGFDIPIHRWFRGALRPFLLDTVSRDAVLATGMFDWPAVEQMLRDHFDRRANLGYHLWGLMVLLVWMKRWNVEVPRATMEWQAEQARARAQVGSLSYQQPSYS